MKVRMGRAKIYSDRDTEIPDDAYDIAFWGAGQDEADIVYIMPSDPDSAIKSKVTEIMHHLYTDKGGYR